MICSKIQIDSLSNTVVAFIDCESAVRAMTRLPPRTGAPPAELPPPEPPQAARTASPLTAIRATRVRTEFVRYVTEAPGGGPGGRGRGHGARSTNQTNLSSKPR